MSTVTFDTHEFVKRLRDSGFSEPQAEAITDLQRQATASAVERAWHDWRPDDLATNKAMDARIKETELKIEQARADLKRDLVEMEQRMTIKLGGMMMAAIAIVATLVKLL
jgi:DNA-binding transcriptional MerR regulator